MLVTLPVLTFLVLFLSSSNAFLSSKMTRRSRLFLTSTRLHGMIPREEPLSDNDDRFDLEAARRRLEAMMGGEENQSGQAVRERRSSPINRSLAPPPPLTTIAKERRVAELQLLESLADSDDGLSDLWSLWFSERGPDAAADLLRAEELTAEGPRTWPEAEDRLRKLIDEHGVHWAEPVNRLATLMYTQGRLEESKALCESVLSVKPWHFGALSGIVMVCAAMGDAVAARQWAARRLPPIQATGKNRRRSEWVQHALEDARESLAEAEERVRQAFGEPDVRPDLSATYPSSFYFPQDDEDSWQ